MSNRIIIQRGPENGRQTNGLLSVVNHQGDAVYSCITLELPWRNNERGRSHIPRGRYVAIRHNSPKFGKCVHVQGVKGRSEILIHPANYVEQLQGCIAVGRFLKDVDGDGAADDINLSRTVMDELMSLLPDEFTVTVQDYEPLS
jgi:hypothetical protein